MAPTGQMMATTLKAVSKSAIPRGITIRDSTGWNSMSQVQQFGVMFSIAVIVVVVGPAICYLRNRRKKQATREQAYESDLELGRVTPRSQRSSRPPSYELTVRASAPATSSSKAIRSRRPVVDAGVKDRIATSSSIRASIEINTGNSSPARRPQAALPRSDTYNTYTSTSTEEIARDPPLVVTTSDTAAPCPEGFPRCPPPAYFPTSIGTFAFFPNGMHHQPQLAAPAAAAQTPAPVSPERPAPSGTNIWCCVRVASSGTGNVNAEYDDDDDDDDDDDRSLTPPPRPAPRPRPEQPRRASRPEPPRRVSRPSPEDSDHTWVSETNPSPDSEQEPLTPTRRARIARMIGLARQSGCEQDRPRRERSISPVRRRESARGTTSQRPNDEPRIENTRRSSRPYGPSRPRSPSPSPEKMRPRAGNHAASPGDDRSLSADAHTGYTTDEEDSRYKRCRQKDHSTKRHHHRHHRHSSAAHRARRSSRDRYSSSSGSRSPVHSRRHYHRSSQHGRSQRQGRDGEDTEQHGGGIASAFTSIFPAVVEALSDLTKAHDDSDKGGSDGSSSVGREEENRMEENRQQLGTPPSPRNRMARESDKRRPRTRSGDVRRHGNRTDHTGFRTPDRAGSLARRVASSQRRRHRREGDQGGGEGCRTSEPPHARRTRSRATTFDERTEARRQERRTSGNSPGYH